MVPYAGGFRSNLPEVFKYQDPRLTTVASGSSPPGVEDPISAIFDLSDRVAQMAPRARQMYLLNMFIVVIWIFIMLILLAVGVHGSAVLALLAFIGLAMGVGALWLLRETNRFFKGFVARHRTIRLVRDAEPVVKVPEGRTPIERLAHYLSTSNERVGEDLRENPDRLRYQVSWPVKGTPVKFDLAIARPGGFRWSWTGGGSPGYVVLGRVGPETVQLDDLRKLENDLKSVLPRLPGQVGRVILLRPKGAPLSEEVYEYAVGHPVMLRKGLKKYRVNTEIITEGQDGTYDFVPVVVGVP